MIDVIGVIEMLIGKPALQHDVDWLEGMLERDEEKQRRETERATVLQCGCRLGWCDCYG